MHSNKEIFASWLRAVLEHTGAVGATLWVPPAAGPATNSSLIREGSGEPIPELVDPESAGLLPTDELPSDSKSRILASRDTCCQLVQVSNTGRRPSGIALRRSSDRLIRKPQTGPCIWLGLRFAACESIDELWSADPSISDAAVWTSLLELGAHLVSQARRVIETLLDPISGLSGRMQFQVSLARALDAGERLAVILINPDDYESVNERFSRRAGDCVLRAIADRARLSLRSSDALFRYGGAVFAVVLAGATPDGATRVAHKIWKSVTEDSFLDGALRLGFSIGLAAAEPRSHGEPDVSEVELVNRAGRALQLAKLPGGNRVVMWRPGPEAEEVGNLDRLAGIFTANLAKDYRNMLLLWDTVEIVAETAELDLLAGRIVQRLFVAFKPARVALFEWTDAEQLRLVRESTREDSPAPSPLFLFGAGQKELVDAAVASGKFQEQETTLAGPAGANEERWTGAAPLMARHRCFGCLVIDGPAARLRVDGSDRVFLAMLGRALASAFERARMADRETARLERRRRRLESEVADLRLALRHTRLAYRSKEMEAVVDEARRIAATDATVLIHGESGTGKQLLAETIHRLSSRADKPLSIVDCGAISHSLIDSELFGHVRGAFTGAERSRKGRLAEADSGVVLLDEIGELPLGVQSKLLRFVEEKRLVPVGGSSFRDINIRIIAVTHRDLTAEVAAGRFREDLYYRLAVLRVEVPALRDRPDDILHLALLFLQRFSVEYQKAVRRFSPKAEALLQGFSWPGNVRQLLNCIMRAVIFCDGEEIGPEHLIPIVTPLEPADSRAPAASPSGKSTAEAAQISRGPRAALRNSWREILEEASRGDFSRPLPIGKWLIADFIAEASVAAGGVLSRGAALLGMPETTFRRRLLASRKDSVDKAARRPAFWDEIQIAISRLVAAGNPASDRIVDLCKQDLLDEICRRFPGDAVLGAGLIGVTVSTLRRWTAELELIPENERKAEYQDTVSR